MRCYIHAKGLRAKWRALTRSQSLAFLVGSVSIVFTVAGIFISVYAWKNPHFWDRPHPNLKAAAPLTLESLFKTDFPNVMKLTISSEPTVFENGEKVTVVSQEYADFSAKTSFIGHYIPTSPFTFRTCVRLANSAQLLLSEFQDRLEVQRYDSSGTSLKGLTFSGRVFIYHETPLSLKEKAMLVDYFKSKNLSVDFYGLDYLRDQTMARKLKQSEAALQ